MNVREADQEPIFIEHAGLFTIMLDMKRGFFWRDPVICDARRKRPRQKIKPPVFYFDTLQQCRDSLKFRQ
jgi:hypothetical protein